jgi:SRSO17 transposase
MSKRQPTVVVMFCPQFRQLVGDAERYLPLELIYHGKWDLESQCRTVCVAASRH